MCRLVLINYITNYIPSSLGKTKAFYQLIHVFLSYLPNGWQSCANTVAQFCHHDGTLLPHCWQTSAKQKILVGKSYFMVIIYRPTLYRAEERNQKRYAEIHHKTVEEGNDNKVLSGRAGDDGQGGVHGSGSTR